MTYLFRHSKKTIAVLLLFAMAVIGITFNSPAEVIIYGDGLLITNTGKVIRGKISVLKNGYAVEMPSGATVSYPFSTIICEAKSLREAYRKQREAMTRPTAGQHVRLAQWAFKQNLFAEAEREIHSALNLQPNNQQAKRLLKHFDKRKMKDSEYVDEHQKKMRDKLLIDRAFSKGEPLGGLSPELAQEFASIIEPLLINRCSNASCHGVSVAHEFHLQRKWNMRGNTRHITGKNLEAVLKQINSTRPDKSPLITKLNGKHGFRKKNVFNGTLAEKQKRILQNWTMRTGLHLQEQHKQEGTSFTQLVGHEEMNQPLNERIQQAGQTSPEIKKNSKTSSKTLEKTRKEQAYDPFDPDVFNRKMHRK